MDKDQGYVTEKVLELTLQIIYLLTGEDCKVVKKSSGEPLTSNSNLNEAAPITEPPPHGLTPENKAKKILEVTQKNIDLMIREVPIRCQDVTVSVTGYLEGPKDLYKDIMMASQPALTSRDGSSNWKSPIRCPRPLYSRNSTKEDLSIPHLHQVEKLKKIKVEHKVKEEKMLPSGDQPSMEEEGMITETKQEESSLHMDTNRASNRNPPERRSRPPYSWEYTQDGLIIPRHRQGEELKDIKIEVKEEEEEVLVSEDQPSMEAREMLAGSRREESSLQIGTSSSYVWNAFKNRPAPTPGYKEKYKKVRPSPRSEVTERSTHPSNSTQSSLSHEQALFSCSVCGISFANKNDLFFHLKAHTGDRPYLCLECGKSFNVQKHFYNHQRLHMGVHPYTCPICGKSFAKKQSYVIHQRVHTGEKPYLCRECGKGFTQQSNLRRHQRSHAGIRRFTCFECEKRFTSKRNLLRHLKRTHYPNADDEALEYLV